MIGFSIDEDDDEAPTVVDGQTSAAEMDPKASADAFAALCRELRALGATEVKAFGCRARFG